MEKLSNKSNLSFISKLPNYVVGLGVAMAVVGCGAAKETLDLQGDYQSKAITGAGVLVDGVGCLVQKIDINGLNMKIVQTAYDDSECEGTALGRITTTGHFEIGDDLDIEPGAREMDLEIDKVVATPLKDEWGDVFGIDVTGECELEDVEVGDSKEITGMDCGALGEFPAEESVFFTSFNLTDDYLHFTKLPNESMDHVGTEDDPAPRDKDLEVKYFTK